MKVIYSLTTLIFIAIWVTSCSGEDEWNDWSEFDKMESDSEIDAKCLYGNINATGYWFADVPSLPFFETIAEKEDYIACITSNDDVKRYNEFLDSLEVARGYKDKIYVRLPIIDSTKETIIFAKAFTTAPFPQYLFRVRNYKYIEKGKSLYIEQDGEIADYARTTMIRERTKREFIFPLLVNRPCLKPSEIKLNLKINSHSIQLDFGFDQNQITSKSRKHRTYDCKDCSCHTREPVR